MQRTMLGARWATNNLDVRPSYVWHVHHTAGTRQQYSRSACVVALPSAACRGLFTKQAAEQTLLSRMLSTHKCKQLINVHVHLQAQQAYMYSY